VRNVMYRFNNTQPDGLSRSLKKQYFVNTSSTYTIHELTPQNILPVHLLSAISAYKPSLILKQRNLAHYSLCHSMANGKCSTGGVREGKSRHK